MKNKFYNRLSLILPYLILLGICFISTYPLFTRFNSVIPGFESTDESYNVLWNTWRIKHALLHNLSLTNTELIAHPFGINLYESGVFAYGWLAWTHLLSIYTTPVISFNFQAIFNMLSIAIITYLLVNFLTKSKITGVFSGIILGFCPYQFVRMWQHLSLTYNQLIVFIIFTALLLKESSTRFHALMFLFAFFSILSFDFSIMYIGIISISIFFVYVLFYNWKNKLAKHDLFAEDFKYLKKISIMGLLAFIVLSPQFAPIIKKTSRLSSSTPASAHNLYHRSFEDLFAQSARPLSYLLPASTHPVFGKFTENFIGTSLYGESFTEHTLYSGHRF